MNRLNLPNKLVIACCVTLLIGVVTAGLCLAILSDIGRHIDAVLADAAGGHDPTEALRPLVPRFAHAKLTILLTTLTGLIVGIIMIFLILRSTLLPIQALMTQLSALAREMSGHSKSGAMRALITDLRASLGLPSE